VDPSAPGRFFYRDRLDYRRTLIEFGRTLTNEVRFDPMLVRSWTGFLKTLLVDRLAIFVENAMQPGQIAHCRSMGVRLSESWILVSSSRPGPSLPAGHSFF